LNKALASVVEGALDAKVGDTEVTKLLLTD
jgi:hypothetical protein